MTPLQRKMARHALGLPNRDKRSYRNRYVATEGPAGTLAAWQGLVKAGLAVELTKHRVGQNRSYVLTPAGAQAAIDPGEALCPEDFPLVPR